MHQIRVGTFNVGSGWSDYRFMVNADEREGKLLNEAMEKEYSPELTELMKKTGRTKEDNRKIEEEINKIQRRILDNVERSAALRLADNCDVICLQEVQHLGRAFIETLIKEKGFQIYHSVAEADSKEGRFSTAIALRPQLFSAVKNISIRTPDQGPSSGCGQEVAAVQVTLKNTDTTVAFGSLHGWGFKLYHPSSKENRQYSRGDRQDMQRADGYVQRAMQHMQQQIAHHNVLAGDMNNNPANYRSTFDMVQSSGYAVLEPDTETNVNSGDLGYKFRKLDFIFQKMESLLAKILRVLKSIFCKTTKMEWGPAVVFKDFAFTGQQNCSDHKPVISLLTVREETSALSRLRNCFR